MAHPTFPQPQTTRRSLLKSAVFGSVAAIAAPYVKDSYAAGSLALGVWDHWVPGANNAFAALCNEWGTKNNVEVRIDFITSQGEKDKLTAAAEAQAGTGHDIMSHRDWSIRTNAELLEPLDEIAAALIKQYGPISPVAEYLAKIKGAWRGVPAASGSQVKPCCSRLDLYKEHAGIDLREVFPPDETKWDSAKVDSWNWDAYLAAAEKLFKAGYPVGLPMGQTSELRRLGWRAVQRLWRRHGRRQGQHQDQFRRDARGAGIRQEADGCDSARRLRLGRCRQQPLAHFRQGVGHHEPAERLGGRQARQPESGGELLDASDAARPQGPLRRAAAAILRLVELLEEQGRGKGFAALHLAEAAGRKAGGGVVRLRPAFVQEHVRPRHLEDRRAAARHRLRLSAARR